MRYARAVSPMLVVATDCMYKACASRAVDPVLASSTIRSIHCVARVRPSPRKQNEFPSTRSASPDELTPRRVDAARARSAYSMALT